MLLFRQGASVGDFQIGRKNKHRLINILQCRTTLLTCTYYQKSQMEARQSLFMHPSCLKAHATPRRQSGDRGPCNPPLYPPAPADTRDDAGLARGAVLGVHARTRHERRKEEEKNESAKKMEKTKNRR